MSAANQSVRERRELGSGAQNQARDGPQPALSLRRLPFRVRLTLSFAVVMVVLFGSLALLLQTRFAASLDQGITGSLKTRAADLAPLVQGKQALPDLPESGGAFAQIIDLQTNRVLDATPGHATRLLTRNEVRRAAVSSLLVDRANARLLGRPVATRPAGVLVVGSSLSERDRALTTLNELLFIGGPVMLVLTCLAGYVLAARALAPVQRMSTWAAQISGAPRGERLPVPEANDELHRLGETLNAMLARLEGALRRERTFIADAGHELRTPLSILKLELELALASDSSRDELETRLRSAVDEVDRLAKLARELLVIARDDQEGLPLQTRRIDVRHVVGAVAARFAAQAEGKGRTITIEGSDGLVVTADKARLEQAVANMVLNALRHGDGTVAVRAGERNGSVEVHVLDEGDGFEPSFLPRAFERFSRADAARSRGGAGLGLSIVQVIAQAHGGGAYAANRESGGADVWVSLPAAQPPDREERGLAQAASIPR
ncbi:MAG TPA: ATP-binding protein [Solirubrobacteraceae bacterium]